METASYDLVFWLASAGGSALCTLLGYAWWVRNEGIRARDILHKRINALT